jgi:hypothetical protein
MITSCPAGAGRMAGQDATAFTATAPRLVEQPEDRNSATRGLASDDGEVCEAMVLS